MILPTDGVEICRIESNARSHSASLLERGGSAVRISLRELTKLGVDVIGESQLVGYPSQYPSVSMIDYNNGKPNARYWVLKLIKDNFHPGDKLVDRKPSDGSSDVRVQGFITAEGKRVLLVNRANSEKSVKVAADLVGAASFTVDEDTGDGEPRVEKLQGQELKMAPFAVTVLKIE